MAVSERRDTVGDDIYIGDKCCECGLEFRKGDKVRYYGGPFMFHAACLAKIIDAGADDADGV